MGIKSCKILNVLFTCNLQKGLSLDSKTAMFHNVENFTKPQLGTVHNCQHLSICTKHTKGRGVLRCHDIGTSIYFSICKVINILM